MEEREKESKNIADKFIAKYNIKTDKVKTREGIAKCVEYIGNGPIPSNEDAGDYVRDLDIFFKMLSETNVKIKYLGARWNYFNDNDNNERDIYRMYLERNDKKVSFLFGASLNMTWNNEKPSLYDVFTSVESDYTLGMEGYEEFCSTIGADTDSIRALKKWKQLDKQFKKLESIFDETEIYAMPR